MIWYDKSNPSGSQASDPCVTYQTEKAKEASSLGAWYGNIGMGLIIIGLLMAYAIIKNFFGHLFGSKKSLASS
jgi:hypothetical protein